MLRRIALQDFVIVQALDLDIGAGFSVLTGETGAGKSILIDALQLALGSRGDAALVREGAARAEIVTMSVGFTRPSDIASMTRYMVMTLVIEAGYRRLSPRRENRTSPVSASTTTAA